MTGQSDAVRAPAPDWGADGAPETAAAPGLPPLSRLMHLTDLQVLRALDSGPRGLDERQAELRLAERAEQAAAPSRGTHLPRRLGRVLRDPYIATLCLITAATAAIGTRTGTAVLALLVVLSCALRLASERRADSDAARLRTVATGTATVLRRAVPGAAPLARELPADQLVPGDVVRLSAGDRVPADLRLLRSSGLALDQSALTGESLPAAKHPLPAGADPGGGTRAMVADPRLCPLGSHVISGTATAVVLATGTRTQATGTGPQAAPDRSTAFARAARCVSGLLLRATLAALLAALVLGTTVDERGSEILPFAAAVAIGLTPEMLPLVVTTTLARAAAVLRRRRVIVRHLPAAHNLGSIDVLCADKTGTLTRDRLTVQFAVGPAGDDAPEVLRWAAVNSLISAELGDPPVLDGLDEALLSAGEEEDEAGTAGPVGVDLIPAGPRHPLATAVIRRSSRPGVHTLVVKGAVDEVLGRCSRTTGGGTPHPLDDARRAAFTATANHHAEQGLRLLAVATADRPARTRPYGPADEHGLTLLGLVALRDETEPTAPAATAALAGQGITVKIVTGDHPGTAARACRDVGLDPGTVVCGADLDLLDDAALRRTAAATTVFARTTPEHKARIVHALRADGHTVGFLGDGLNDLPALRAADVGICPLPAQDEVREQADVVLAAADLEQVGLSVATARRAPLNISSYLRVALASNTGNTLAMLVGGAALPFLPMLPTQALVQNVCFDAAQLALAFDRSAPDDAPCPPPPRRRSLAREALLFGLVNAAADLVTFAMLWVITHGLGDAHAQELFRSGWFTENLLTQALTVHLLRGPLRGRRPPAPWPVRCANLALAATGLLLPLSPVGALLGMRPPTAPFYALLAAVLALYAPALLLTRHLAGRPRRTA